MRHDILTGKQLDDLIEQRTGLSLMQFAESLGYPPSVTRWWSNLGMPKKACERAAQCFPERLHTHELRPDLFPPAQQGARHGH